MIGTVRKLVTRWLAGTPVLPAPAHAASAAEAPAELQSGLQSIFSSGVAAFRAGRYHDAAACFERFLENKHDDSEAQVNLGLAYQKLGRLDEAADCFVLALQFSPGYPEAHFNLGVVALQQARFADAVSGFERAIALKPDYAEALNNLGYAQFYYLDEALPAEENLRRAIALKPALLDAHCNLGMWFQHQGRLDEALAKYDEVLQRDPAQHEARLNRALLLLARGNFAKGWPEYEIRKIASPHFCPRGFVYPEWQGQEIAEKTVLVYGEQGLGDEILFASCLPDLIARAGHCVIDCSPKLEKLFRRSFPGTVVHGAPQTEHDTSWLSAVLPIDYQVAIGSLPLHFRSSATDFPRRRGYLTADPARAEYWRQRLDRLGPGLKVGISWTGGTPSTRQRLRSTILSDWLPIFRIAGCHFVNLQYGRREPEITGLDREHGIKLCHWPEAIDDYDETAALVSALDLVVSVQTAVVHLCGALGRGVWVLVPVIPEWRYLASGEASPWYPSVRLFRQARPGEWRPVIERIAGKVRDLVNRSRGVD